MMTDITCPVELLSLEQAAFDQGRRQGYLKLRNEGAAPICLVEGTLALLDAQGAAAGRRPVRLEPSDAPPGQPFECRLALDEYPPFESALLLAERVAFADGSVWTPDPARMMDATPPALEQGPERVALVAVAGHDAVCYPERRDSLWICACGRFNRWRWHACRRCGRDRDETLSRLTPARVQAAYARFVALEQAEEQQRLIRRAQESARKKRRLREAARRARRAALRKRRLLAALAALALLALLGYGLARLFTYAPYTGDGVTVELSPSPSIDYLRPVSGMGMPMAAQRQACAPEACAGRARTPSVRGPGAGVTLQGLWTKSPISFVL